MTSFLLHHILKSTCVQGVVCLSALSKNHNPCQRNICQRATAGQRDGHRHRYAEKGRFLKISIRVPALGSEALFRLFISFCFVLFFLPIKSFVVFESPDSVSTILLCHISPCYDKNKRVSCINSRTQSRIM